MPVEIASEAQILENVKRNILAEKRAYLCKYLNPDDHFDFLRSKSLLSKDDQEIIKHEMSQKARAGKLLDILETKGPNAYEMLVYSIQRNKTQTFLVEMLNKEFENKKNTYIALLKNRKNSMEAELEVDINTLPKPGSKPSTKKCIESEDKTLSPVTPELDLDKDFNEMCIRQSFADCQNMCYSNNGHSEHIKEKDHDKNCSRHQSDA